VLGPALSSLSGTLIAKPGFLSPSFLGIVELAGVALLYMVAYL